jgi:hypothetical protein
MENHTKQLFTDRRVRGKKYLDTVETDEIQRRQK